MTKRASYLHVSEQRLLHDWGAALAAAFNGKQPYHVGSSLDSKDWRDVDVRIMLDDARYEQLASVVDVQRLGLALSLWGQRATGLPIDCQVQRTSEANAKYKGARHPIGGPL